MTVFNREKLVRITIVLGPFFPVPPVRGGAVEKVHSQLALAYVAAGHDVTLISRRYGDFKNEEIVDGVKHLRISSFDKPRTLVVSLLLDLIYALRVSRQAPASDVTITNSFFTPLFLGRRRAGKIYVHVARYPKRQMWLYARADRLQAISQAVAKAMIKQSPRVAKKVVSIGYPVPDQFFRSDQSPARKNIILYVGRIAREKGIHLLLKAINLLNEGSGRTAVSQWAVRIVGPYAVTEGGDGAAYWNELKALVQPSGVPCEFVGPIFDQPALIAEYQAASIFVYPSLAETGEAFGLAALEAMAAGCATVVSDLRCFDDFIRDRRNGLIFDHRNPDPEKALALQLARLVDDPLFLRTIAIEGMNTAQEFKMPIIARKMLADFDSLQQ